MAATFGEISDQLAKAIADVSEKKKEFDEATNAVTDASNRYHDAITRAKDLRDMLTKNLDDSLGAAQTNVRQSS